MRQMLFYRSRHYAVFINLDAGDPKVERPPQPWFAFLPHNPNFPQNVTDEWPLDGVEVVRWEQALDMDLDIVMELGMQMRQDQVDSFQKRGIKVSVEPNKNSVPHSSTSSLVFSSPPPSSPQPS